VRARGPAVLAAVVLLGAPGCSRTPRDPVAACLDAVVTAGEKRDADGVLARVSESFRDAGGGGKAETAELVRRSLAAYEALLLTLTDLAVTRGPAAAQARFKLRMSGRPRAVAGLEGILPRSSRWSFDVRLEKEGSDWKITSAAWTRLEDAP
jgi:hypothetical protein